MKDLMQLVEESEGDDQYDVPHGDVDGVYASEEEYGDTIDDEDEAIEAAQEFAPEEALARVGASVVDDGMYNNYDHHEYEGDAYDDVPHGDVDGVYASEEDYGDTIGDGDVQAIEAAHEFAPEEALARVGDNVVDDGMYNSFEHHVASRLSMTPIEDRGPLVMKLATPYYNRWLLSSEPVEVQNLVKACPLYEPLVSSFPFAEGVIISGFIERWHPETSTFHLPFGEMTITLDDVLNILGIPVTGKILCEPLPDKREERIRLFSDLLGIDSADIGIEFAGKQSYCFRFTWLKKSLAGRLGKRIGSTVSYVTAEHIARGYLLSLIGCTLFSDKTGDKVPAKYLLYLADLSKVSEWAWGAAALARLYRNLGTASRADTKQMGGYLTLLEAWVYEHFPSYRPQLIKPWQDGMPRTSQWVVKNLRLHQNVAFEKLERLREKLNKLTFHDVIMMPYRDFPNEPEEIAWFTGVLVDDDITEPYHPERVLRQLGHVQIIPERPYKPYFVQRHSSPTNYRAEYAYWSKDYARYENHVVSIGNRGPKITAQTGGNWCTPEYVEWYKIARTWLGSKDEQTRASGGEPEGEEKDDGDETDGGDNDDDEEVARESRAKKRKITLPNTSQNTRQAAIGKGKEKVN